MENISSGFEMEEASGSEGTQKPSTTSQCVAQHKPKKHLPYTKSEKEQVVRAYRYSIGKEPTKPRAYHIKEDVKITGSKLKTVYKIVREMDVKGIDVQIIRCQNSS